MKRCSWAQSPIMIEYHDNEWGVPVHDDKKLFEFLILECMQAGLTWELILKRRENYRKALNNFDYKKIAKYNNKDAQRLLSDSGIIRNKLKINAIITNAQKFLEV